MMQELKKLWSTQSAESLALREAQIKRLTAYIKGVE